MDRLKVSKRMAFCAALSLALTTPGLLGVTVTGPDEINWKGVTWTVDANAEAEVLADGSLRIGVDGDTGDPAADNWNVHADLSQLGLDFNEGVFVEFSFLDDGPDGQGAYSGGPRAYLDTWENRTYEYGSTTDDYRTEYMFQGGMYDGYADYYVNHATYISGLGWNKSNWFYPGLRSAGKHTFRAELWPDDRVALYYDGVFMAELTGPESVPTFFETAFLGVTSNSVAQGSPGSGIYTDFRAGQVPEPMTMLAFGSAVAGLGGYIRRRRRA